MEGTKQQAAEIKTNKMLKSDLGAELQGHAWLIEV
jgi:hypothetical protein